MSMNTHQSVSIHNAHFPLSHCLEIAAQLEESGHYERVQIKNRVFCDNEYYARVYVEPKVESDDVFAYIFD